MDLQLTDRTILVAGGHGYIGQAVVQRLRAEGAIVVPASRHAPDGLVLDATDDDSVRTAIESILAEHGRIDGLVVAAAPSARTLDSSKNNDPRQVAQAFEGKVLTFLRLANAVLPVMHNAGFGRIVAVSGQNAFKTGNLTGSVRNAALVIAAKNLADEAAGSGVTVNVVSPGIVSDDPHAEVKRGDSGETSPLEIADLIAFLLSPLARAISGESIAVGHRLRGASGL